MGQTVERHTRSDGTSLILESANDTTKMRESTCHCGWAITGLPGREAGQVIIRNEYGNAVYHPRCKWGHLACAKKVYEEMVAEDVGHWTYGRQRDMVEEIKLGKALVCEFDESRSQSSRYRWRVFTQ